MAALARDCRRAPRRAVLLGLGLGACVAVWSAAKFVSWIEDQGSMVAYVPGIDELRVNGGSIREIRKLTIRSLIDSEQIFRIQCDEAVFVTCLKILALERGLVTSVIEDMQRLAPSWRRSIARAGDVFATSGFRSDCRGPDGLYFACVYDRKGSVMYLWRKDMF